MLRNQTLLEDHEREESDENECEGPEFRRRILCLHHAVKEITESVLARTFLAKFAATGGLMLA